MAAETMRPEILDTNVLLRFLVGDNKAQQKTAEQWFREGEQRKRNIVLTPLVVAEACFVLESFYKKPRKEIAGALEVFISQKWLQVEDREVLLGLWFSYGKGLHFVDSFLLSLARVRKGSVLTFDQSLAKKTMD